MSICGQHTIRSLISIWRLSVIIKLRRNASCINLGNVKRCRVSDDIDPNTVDSQVISTPIIWARGVPSGNGKASIEENGIETVWITRSISSE